MNCFTNDNSKLYSKIFQSFWAIYISFNISKKYKEYKNLNSDNEEYIKIKKRILIVKMLSSASDWLICLNGSGISKAVTGHNIPDFWRGLQLYLFMLRN